MEQQNNERLENIISLSLYNVQKRELLRKRKELIRLTEESNKLFSELKNVSLSCPTRFIVKIEDTYYCLECFGVVGEHLITPKMQILEVNKDDNKSDIEILEGVFDAYIVLLMSHPKLSEEEAFNILINESNYIRDAKRKVLSNN